MGETVQARVEHARRVIQIHSLIPGRVGFEPVRQFKLGEQLRSSPRHAEDHGVGKVAAEDVNALLEAQLVRLSGAQIELEATRLHQGSRSLGRAFPKPIGYSSYAKRCISLLKIGRQIITC